MSCSRSEGQHGQLVAHRQEHIINQKLYDVNLNIDRHWTLCFSPHDDARDQRPLLYIGRIALPMAKLLKDSVWRKSSLVSSAPVIGPLRALKTSDLVEIEDVGECALPNTTDTSSHVSQHEKIYQLGTQCCQQILQNSVGSVVSEGPKVGG